MVILDTHTLLWTFAPHIHEDPFDRMIIAQAKTRGLSLVTKDQNI